MADTQITAARPRPVPPSRPEYLRDVVASGDIGVVQKPLTLWQLGANASATSSGGSPLYRSRSGPEQMPQVISARGSRRAGAWR